MLLEKSNKYYETIKDKKEPKPYYVYNNTFTLPDNMELMLMSDLHTATTDIIDDLIKTNKISKNVCVISTGDISGNGKMGGDADPYLDYVKINTGFKYLKIH